MSYGKLSHYGFRIVRRMTSEEIAAAQQEAELEAQRIIEELRKNPIINSIELITINDMQIEMLKTEVTQALYQTVMEENPSLFRGDDLPVESVSWYDAIYFCNKLSEIKDLTPVYSVNGSTSTSDWNYTPHNWKTIDGAVEQDEVADGFRLPTSDEWEYAANGGEGYKYAGSNDIDEVGWYKNNSETKTHPVAQKKPNGYGLCDMSGNVSEWCWDSASYKYSSYKYDSDQHVVRGGAIYDSSSKCEVGKTDDYMSYGKSSHYGFRIVRRMTSEKIAEEQSN
ncbi:MAG: SUMF1/EgtB/PvdO family nonheme iron enzyme [Spirochaetaceae bacterium]|nr:SUMF1/EgtB/PvdO family nonheme iron enzyme [Spirochaetaceae bacterium]